MIKFQEEKDLFEICLFFEGVGIEGVQVQCFGEFGEYEVIIKMFLLDDVGGDFEGIDLGSCDEVVVVFNVCYNSDFGNVFDFNEQGSDVFVMVFFIEDFEGFCGGDDDLVVCECYCEIVQEIMEVCKQDGIIWDFDLFIELFLVMMGIVEVLCLCIGVGVFNVFVNDVVGLQIGGELCFKGILVVMLLFFGMLFYIWLCFELCFGIGVFVVLMYDVVICFGIYVFMGYEFDLMMIVVFLIVVGYLVNDFVVVFDCVCENLCRNWCVLFNELFNLSFNQMLFCIVFIFGMILFVVGMFYVFGGDVICGFVFIVFIGVVIGIYLLIFIVSLVVFFWECFFGCEVCIKWSVVMV